MTDLIEIFGSVIIGVLAATFVCGFIGLATIIVHGIMDYRVLAHERSEIERRRS